MSWSMCTASVVGNGEDVVGVQLGPGLVSGEGHIGDSALELVRGRNLLPGGKKHLAVSNWAVHY